MTKYVWTLLVILLLVIIATVAAMGWTWDDSVSKTALGFFDGN